MYLLLVCAALLFSTQFIFTQKFQKSRGDGYDSSLLFQIYSSVAMIILMFLLNRFQIKLTLFSVIVGAIYAVDIILYIYFSMKAFSTANLSVYSIFTMLGGMILPFVYGTVFANEEITIPKVVSCILIMIALFMTFEKGKSAKNSKWYYLAVFFFNGMMGVFSAIHQSNTEHSVDSRSYLAITYTVVFLISLVWYIKRNKKFTLISTKELLYASGYSVSNGIAELFCLIALMQLPASVQYPIITGGTILFSAAVSVIFEKQRSRRIIISALIALVASIVIAL